MRKILLLSLIFFSGLIISLGCKAEDEEVRAVRIDFPLEPITEEVSKNSVDVLFTYDPSQLENNVQISKTWLELQELNHQMNTEKYQKSLEGKEVIVPISVDNKELLENTKSLTEEELEKFLSKKTEYLNKLAKTFKVFYLPAKKINKILNNLNQQFYRNAKVVANSNEIVRNLALGGSLGLGLNDWLVKQARKIPLLQNLPERSGFYFLFNLGISVIKRIENGKVTYRLEPVIEFRRATRIFSPFIFGAFGFTYTRTWENQKKGQSVQSADYYKISIVNILSGLSQFGFSFAAAAVFPPGGGSIAGMEGVSYRVKLTPALLKAMMDMAQNFLKSHAKACTRALR